MNSQKQESPHEAGFLFGLQTSKSHQTGTWWLHRDLNPGPQHYECYALTN
ncbi:hypothetical protein ALP74_200147 [Pseudomonas coronafaciens pv. garcae]|uniref:Uncharacterized protein n=1 Tax=Pseudomonas coronafaciens pv. garcae TaxID=251653 RepID=A0AB37QKJ4_9PSED|nr:hypothetical protein ALP74_200147 [Pseudomonas coronafaciens pv. garcae]